MRVRISKLFIFTLLFLFFMGNHALETFSAQEKNNIEKELAQYFTEHTDDIAGLATIVINEDDVLYKMEGYANIEEQLPVDTDTVFEWGSVSKILIWISVMQLVEKGTLDLDTDIKTYLPSDFHSKTVFDTPVTLRHLMNHTAGFDDSYTDLMVHQPNKIDSLQTVLEKANVKQVFPPGEIVAYSNYGSGLAAFIVEEVSGLDYREYVRKNIFERLQMTKTAMDPSLNDNEWVKEQRKMVQGYSHTLQRITPNFYSIPMYPVGSVTGTAQDLQKLLHALLTKDGSPLFQNKLTIERMFEPTLYYADTDIPRIAHGLFYLPAESNSVYGHGGNSKAFSASFYVDRKEQTGVIVLANIANESTFTAGIPEIIFGEFHIPESDSSLETSSKWEGIYEPARLPHHGFSKIYGLFLRSETKQHGPNSLNINDTYYTQLAPGIYKTTDDFSMYSLDIYSSQSQTEKRLSNKYADLMYVPYYKHYIEWGGVVFAFVAIITSFLYISVFLFKKIRQNERMHKLLFMQHSLNILLSINVFWIIYKTLSMVSYSFLQPFLLLNLAYVILSVAISAFLVMQMRTNKLSKNGKVVRFVTVIFSFVLCVNVLYWEFYY